ncbi:hypothetical protein P170DRAFT_431366 [Aspergillus steynii IBT 23096]|uniref:Uncharacterized protein n=1 Tax=Aspergillus steynii IBT 23096 TaxID=1392250 RepID=A0A2I2FS18_9EURO|nr:uncharacterized protein P170DRAFT_431366 [Aspergillus steynii IBT 23096]PLB43424.1 hypothetical protein P170DRAFT_431366 [Aspergillus steynii IBT 23096]
MAQPPVQNPPSSAVLTYSSSMYRSRQDSISKDMAQVAAFPVYDGNDEKIPVTPFALPTSCETTTDSNPSLARRPTRKSSKPSFLGSLRRRKTVGEKDEPPKQPPKQPPQQPLHIVPDFELNHEDPRYLKPRAVSMAITPTGKTKASQSISLPFNPDKRPFNFGQDNAAETMRASYKREIQTKDARIKLLESHLVNLATGITEMDKDRKRLQSQARSSPGHPKSDRSSTSGKKLWTTKSTPQVREDLSMLEQRMRSWAIKNSVTDISDLDHLDGEEKSIILEELEGFCAETDWNTLIRATPIVLHRMPALLTQALLSKDVYATAFMNPFFAFAEDSTGGLPTSRMLKAMYSTMLEVNPSEAHVWRSQTLRVLSAPPSTPNEESLLAQRVREVTSELAVDFLNGPVQALLRTPRTEAELVKRNQEVYSLYHSAGELALSLWTQRAFMKFHNLHGLKRFRTGNPAMTAHPLQHLSEDDERLDGKRVLLVVQPAVVAYGDEEAQNYDMCKVWAKGVVLVDENEGKSRPTWFQSPGATSDEAAPL